jgi:hypothetical protein
MKTLAGYTAGQKVFVYFNLHKKLFSVRDHITGLVVGHTDMIALENVTFKVSEAGRQRVLREKRKNVHAGVLGTVKDLPIAPPGHAAFYNPYKYSSFVDINGQAVLKASTVLLHKDVRASITFDP